MCGILGIISHNCKKHRQTLRVMRETLLHRGPDEQGEFFGGNCLLGHTRLSIVDLKLGRQPLSNDSGITVVFNGELYGYKEIRKQIVYNYKTESDTELILALYDKYGEQCCEHMPGMFAFALWDETRQKLFCGRDRFGEKPFYYALTESGEFVFASEQQAIIASGLIDPAINREAVSQYLTLRYVPETMSIYRNIQVLKPGHGLVFQNGEVRTFQYWRSNLKPFAQIGVAEANEEFSWLMSKAVKKCLVADVEIGLLLSGGLDSTTIAFLASQHTELRSFAFGFRGERSEVPFARDAARRYNLPLAELEEESVDFPEMLLKMSHIYGEPFADSSAIPTYVLCKHVSKEVKVALSGDGGDELLAGYDYWYRPLLTAGGRGRANWSEVAERHWNQITYFKEEELLELGLPRAKRMKLYAAEGNINDALQIDIANFLPSDVLKKVDRASMANGLELRCPFLDKELAEFLLKLPWQMKINAESNKIILRECYSAFWPESINARGKQGFGAPIGRWLQESEALPIYSYYLGGRQRKIRDLLPGDFLDAHARTFSLKGWLLLVLAIWMEHNKCSV